MKRKAIRSKKSEAKPEDIKVKLDHRQYGAWYLHPSKWESRFQNLSDPKSIEIVKSRRESKLDKIASKQAAKVEKGEKVSKIL